MKRIISFLLILALLICLVACGNDGESSSSESQVEQSSTETQSESMESESATESETQGNTSSESTVESESQSQSTESVTESESQGQSTETATESEIESETNSESESESTTESETESEIESESSTETERETESESESQNPTTVAELTQKMSRQVNDVFNQHFLDDALKADRFTSLDSTKISNAKWVAKGENEITEVDFVFHYGDELNKQIYVINLKFNKNLELDEVINNASTLTSVSTIRTQKYMNNYTPSVQGTRDELVNALFKAVGVNEVGGPRYFKDNGQTAAIDGLGMANSYTIVEVGHDKILQYNVCVNVASSDSAYISKLENPAEFKITDSKEVDISGASVEYVAQ